MPEDIVRARGLLDPPRVEHGELADARDGFLDVPLLVRVDHQLALAADRFTHQPHAPPVVVRPSADLDLEMREAVLDRFAAQRADLVVGVPHPSDRRRVGRIARAQQLRLALALRARVPLQDVERLVARERVCDVAEIDARDDLPRRHVRQQLPHRLAFHFSVEIPDGVDDRRQREMDHAFLRTEPAQLRVACEPPPERREVRGDVVEPLADDEMAKRIDRGGAHFVASADRERQAMPFDAAVRPKHDVCGGVIGIGMHGVCSRVRTRRRKPQVENVQAANDHFCLHRSSATANTMIAPVTICCTQFGSPCCEQPI